LQEIVVLTSKIRTRLGLILTSKADHLFDGFGITIQNHPGDFISVNFAFEATAHKFNTFAINGIGIKIRSVFCIELWRPNEGIGQENGLTF
jgi:hypothetical protein